MGISQGTVSSLKCNTRGGDHTNKDQACSSPIVKCANCGGNHRNNSLVCLELKKHLPVQRAPGSKFATACASLSKSIHKVQSANKSIFICGDFKTGLENENSYVHNSGFTSDSDFVLTDAQQMQGTMADVLSGILISDQLSL